jgi:flagellar FliL protein
MAEKPDSNAPAPEAAPAAPGAPVAKASVIATWLPLVVALALAPATTWALVEFLFVPRLEAKLNEVVAPAATARGGDAPAASSPAAPSPAVNRSTSPATPGAPIDPSGPRAYQFDNVVVNLAGTMGTRYLKVSFVVGGASEQVRTTFNSRLPQLRDVTLATLSALTLADLEEAGSKNLIRARLLQAYNDELGSRVVDQLYFSEFVVQ